MHISSHGNVIPAAFFLLYCIFPESILLYSCFRNQSALVRRLTGRAKHELYSQEFQKRITHRRYVILITFFFCFSLHFSRDEVR